MKMKMKSVITALLLGALGSGLWSIAGEPLFTWFIEAFIATAQKLNNGYYNLLHENIGEALHEKSESFFYHIFLMTLIIAYIALPVTIRFFLKKCKYKNKPDTELVNSKVKSDAIKSLRSLFVISVVLSIIFIPMYTSNLVVSIYNNSAIVFLERSIEILSPQLNQKDILQLRADYRSISDANGFYTLHDKLQSIAKKNSIVLPEFSIAR